MKLFVDNEEVKAYSARDKDLIEGTISETIEAYVNGAPERTTERVCKTIASGMFAINVGIAVLEQITGDKAMGNELELAFARIIAAKLKRDAAQADPATLTLSRLDRLFGDLERGYRADGQDRFNGGQKRLS